MGYEVTRAPTARGVSAAMASCVEFLDDVDGFMVQFEVPARDRELLSRLVREVASATALGDVVPEVAGVSVGALPLWPEPPRLALGVARTSARHVASICRHTTVAHEVLEPWATTLREAVREAIGAVAKVALTEGSDPSR